jgi:hypothetical protein
MRFTLIALIALILLVSVPAQASEYVSFADPDSTAPRDIYMYAANGTLLGLYNSISASISLPTDSDIIRRR